MYNRLAAFVVNITMAAAYHYANENFIKEPYHTSALSGEGWVLELLSGHSERIRCELAVHHHVFYKLIETLKDLGYSRSKFVSLEEKLAIFLYICVTGLSVRHVGEHFQCANETISKYVYTFLGLFIYFMTSVLAALKRCFLPSRPPSFTTCMYACQRSMIPHLPKSRTIRNSSHFLPML
jgi:hypothetical protein